MNRTLVFGIAVFMAVVGVALISADSNIQAGHKCKCKCSNDCGCNSCCAPADCCSPCNCAPAACGCGSAPAGEYHGEPTPAPAKEAAPEPVAPPTARTPFGFRTVSFQR